MGEVEVGNRSSVAVDPEPLVAQACFILDRLGLHPDVGSAISLVDVEEITAACALDGPARSDGRPELPDGRVARADQGGRP